MKLEAFLIGHGLVSGAGAAGGMLALTTFEAYLFVLPISVLMFFFFADFYKLARLYRTRIKIKSSKRN